MLKSTMIDRVEGRQRMDGQCMEAVSEHSCMGLGVLE